MSNEFYRTEIEGYCDHYFRDKEKAFTYLWQSFLRDYGDLPEEDIEEAANQMNELYFIEDYGAVYVCGFCD